MTEHTGAGGATPDVSAPDGGVRPIRRALLSVYDKTGLVDLASALHAAGVSLVSTGNTARMPLPPAPMRKLRPTVMPTSSATSTARIGRSYQRRCTGGMAT